MFMQSLDSAIINTSLPRMAQSFAVTTVDLSLSITAYMLAAAAVSPLSGFLADRFGSRTVIVTAMLAFTLASVGCGMAVDLPWFVAARLAQGAGGALMLPVGTAVVMRMAGKEQMMRFVALMVWPALAAPIIGPVLGGFITQHIDWRWNFWLNLPLGLVLAGLVAAFVPQHRGEPRRLDWLGFVLCSGALVCLIAGFQRSSLPGGERRVAAALLALGALTGAAALRHLRRHQAPLLSLGVLRYPSFGFCAWLPGVIYYALFSAAPFLLPLLFQLGFGLSPTAAGVWVLVYFVGNLGIKPFTTAILRRFGFQRVMWVNGLLVGATMLGCGMLRPATPSWLIAPVLLAAGATRSMQMTSLMTLVYTDIPNAQKNLASTLLSMLQLTFSALGVALGAFLLALFQRAPGAMGLGVLHHAFWVLALIAAGGGIAFRRMDANIGIEVSQHRPARQKIGALPE